MGEVWEGGLDAEAAPWIHPSRSWIASRFLLSRGQDNWSVSVMTFWHKPINAEHLNQGHFDGFPSLRALQCEGSQDTLSTQQGSHTELTGVFEVSRHSIPTKRPQHRQHPPFFLSHSFPACLGEGCLHTSWGLARLISAQLQA